MTSIRHIALKEVATFFSGGTPSKDKPEYWSGNIPWLTPKDMANYDGSTQDSVTELAIGNGTRIAAKGTIFVAVRGMSLHNEIRIIRSDRPMAFNQDIKAISANGIDSGYLYYALLAQRLNLLSVVESAGHGTGRLPTDRLGETLIPNFDKTTQIAISSLLGAIDNKIDLMSQMNHSIESTAKLLFKDWFIDFGPTRAKMTGQAPYLAPEVWALFPETFDDSGLPSGWNMQTFGEHCINFDSKRIPLSSREREQRKGAFPYHGATGVMDHVDDYLFDGIHLLIGEDGSVMDTAGKAFTQYVWGKFWANNHAHVLKGKGAVCTEHLLLYFQHHDVSPYVTGAVQLKLSQGRMNSMPFVYPGKDLCAALGKEVAPLFEKIRINEDEAATLAKTRDLLLPKLMSGELTVKDADTLVRKTL
jgi:type I restriction enzyme, S subunit